MNNAKYWAKRLVNQQGILYDKSASEAKAQLAKYYRESAERTVEDIGKLYDKLLQEAVSGEVRVNDLYRYNRYFDVKNKLNQELISLGGQEVKLDRETFSKMYERTSALVGQQVPNLPLSSSFGLEQQKAVDKVLNSVWCADGKHWTNRISTNKARLQAAIERGLIDSVSRGVPKDEAIKAVRSAFGASFNHADCLVRTELTYVQNQACLDRYKEAGLKQYEILVEHDDRTSEICEDMDGKIFYYDEAVVGVTVPPFHCNCRSTIIPVI